MKIDNALLDELYTEALRDKERNTKGSTEWFYYCGLVDILELLQTIDKDIDLSNAKDSLKDYALSIIDDLEENEGYDLSDGCYILQWRYDERPDVLVTLTLGDFEIINEQDDGDLH